MAAKASWHRNYVTVTLCTDFTASLNFTSMVKFLLHLAIVDMSAGNPQTMMYTKYRYCTCAVAITGPIHGHRRSAEV